EFREYHVNRELVFYERHLSVAGFAAQSWVKLKWAAEFYFPWPVMALPLLALPWIGRDRWMWWAILGGGAFLIALLMLTWVLPHYTAPAAALLFAMLVRSLQHLRLWQWRGMTVGRNVARLFPVVWVSLFVGSALLLPPYDWPGERVRIERTLHERGGSHL